MKLPKIAAVFATMNRADTAVGCVRALAAQTLPPTWVVVADNVSKDQTVERIESLGVMPFELVIHRMSENRGNAGGVEEAMELAFSMGADGVWILDDDSLPQAQALEELMKPGWSPDVVRHSLQMDPRTQRLTWPLPIKTDDDKWKLIDEMSQLPQTEIVRTSASWTGALISRTIRERVGPVLGDLFIRGEDEEYPRRISDAGYNFEAVIGSLLVHPGPPNIRRWSLGGKTFFFEPGLADWKLYYKIRNMVWLNQRRKGLTAALLMALCYSIAALRCDGLGKLPTVWSAVRDGFFGRLGRWTQMP